MKKMMMINLITAFLFFSSGVYAQHEGHNTADLKDNTKQGMDMKEHAKAMMDSERRFIVHMIEHHQDAVDMAKMALLKSKKEEIKKLSGEIIRAQSSEIEMMKKWYKEWYNTDVPLMETGKGEMMKKGENSRHTEMMYMCMMNSSGGGGVMMNMKMNMNELKDAPDFDKKFIEMMVKHHGMAVMMAGMMFDSKKAEIRKLARDINSAQLAEIEQMIQWHIKWYGGW